MQEITQLKQLQRARRSATLLLVAMAALLLTVRLGFPHLGWLAAFAEAALVGGLADWFAVTALFRHPLGLPIPHTAIIPRNKDRIGESIGNFLQFNFITHDVLRVELAQVDLAGSAADWLLAGDNSKAVARQATQSLPAMLGLVNDDDALRFMRRALSGALGNVRFAPLLAQVLEILVAGRQHHVLLERILGLVARALEQHRPYIRQKVHENSPRWMPRAIDEKFYERLLDGIHSILADIQGEDSEWRLRFEAATHELINNLATSSDYEQKLHQFLANSIGHPSFLAYAGDVWRELRERLLQDAGSPSPQVAHHVDQALRAFALALQQDPVVRDRLNGWLRALVTDAIVLRRDVIAAVVWRVIRSWDTQTVSRKFELQVGRDLQFIRINGTLVGGTVGLLLYALSSMVH
jgi:uncharacterized membrane-anchored protein YjiN (DUF445 family)